MMILFLIILEYKNFSFPNMLVSNLRKLLRFFSYRKDQWTDIIRDRFNWVFFDETKHDELQQFVLQESKTVVVRGR